jgi:hypothetical protein
MALSLNNPKLDNFASDIWKSTERLRGTFLNQYKELTLTSCA